MIKHLYGLSYKFKSQSTKIIKLCSYNINLTLNLQLDSIS